MSDAQPLQILLEDMRRRLARGGMTYAEAVTLEDLITTIAESIRQAAGGLRTGLSDPRKSLCTGSDAIEERLPDHSDRSDSRR